MSRPRSQRGQPIIGNAKRSPNLSRTAGYYVGVDLGQASDYTAVCVGERVEGDPYELRVRHLERFRHVLYPDVVDRVEELVNTPPLAGDSFLLVDKTGVGGGVTDLFTKRGIAHSPISITGGDQVNGNRVPKRELVANLQVLLQSGRLKIAEGLEHAKTLREELRNFKIKVNLKTGHDSYEAWREGDHDDLVLAAALCAWGADLSRDHRIPRVRTFHPERSLLSFP